MSTTNVSYHFQLTSFHNAINMEIDIKKIKQEHKIAFE